MRAVSANFVFACVSVLLCCALFFITVFKDVVSAQNLAQVQLHAHAQDAANQLGLSLSPHLNGPDTHIAKIMSQAMFDSGYYQYLAYTPAQGEGAFSLSYPLSPEHVPSWFVQLINIQAPVVNVAVTNGWQVLGELSVQAHPGELYQELYSQVEWSLYLSSALLCVLLFINGLVKVANRRFTMAFKRYINGVQANNLAEFTYQSAITEYRYITRLLNRFITQNKRVLAQKDVLIAQLEQTVLIDPLTELYSHHAFEKDFAAIQNAEGDEIAATKTAKKLYFATIRLADITHLQGHNGYTLEDNILSQTLAKINHTLALYTTLKAYRLSWCEFVLLGALSEQQADELATLLQVLFVTKRNEVCVPFYLAVLNVQANESRIALFERAQAIINNSKSSDQVPVHSVALLSGLSHSQWEEALHDYCCIIDLLDSVLHTPNSQLNELSAHCEHLFELSFQGVVDAQRTVLFYEVFIGFKYQNAQLPTEDVFTMAERLGCAYSVERAVILTILCHLKGQNLPAVSINISNSVLKDEQFTNWLFTLLEQVKNQLPPLYFELNESAIVYFEHASESFINRAKSLNINIIIDRFGSSFTSFQLIHRLPVEFVKIDGSYIKQYDSTEHRFFVNTVTKLCHGIGIKVIATHVESDHSAQACVAMQLDALQGHGVEMVCTKAEFIEKTALLRERTLS